MRGRVLIWVVHAARMGTACISPAALPPALASHLAKSLASSLPSCGHQRAAQLVDELAALAPAERCSSFCHREGERIVRALERDTQLCTSLINGESSLRDVLTVLDERGKASKAMFDAIQGHHHRLRTLVGEGESAQSEWRAAVEDAGELRRYAQAAAEISTRQWTQQGIDWCAAFAVDFFHGGGKERLLRKEAKRVRRRPLTPPGT